MVQKNASGWRYSQQNSVVIRPLMQNTPKIHDAIWFSPSPPREPVVRMMATGAVAANSRPISPFEANNRPKSDAIAPGVGGRAAGRSKCVSMQGLAGGTTID